SFTSKGFNVTVAFSHRDGSKVPGITASLGGITPSTQSDKNGEITFNNVFSTASVLGFTFDKKNYTYSVNLKSLAPAPPEKAETTPQTAKIQLPLIVENFTETSKQLQKTGGSAVGAIVIGAIFLAVAAGAGFWFFRRRRANATPYYEEPMA